MQYHLEFHSGHVGRLCLKCDLSPYLDNVCFLLYINSKFRYFEFGFPAFIKKLLLYFLSDCQELGILG